MKQLLFAAAIDKYAFPPAGKGGIMWGVGKEAMFINAGDDRARYNSPLREGWLGA